ncbi:SPX domain-containing protein 2-like [Helianthus annuus]|uniref:SPX domain-containing protein 2-like n=1 Tax=Helianthus annuus TaxID=4232 RepID=UPI0016533FEE|nr:SPX domain-containing protein 2-like [Helianthus annuus]
MKFGKSLSNQIEETLPEWRDKFLSYKDLKKRLKLIKPVEKMDHDGNRLAKRLRISDEECPVAAGGELSKEEVDFVQLLEEEVEKFNSFFVEKEEEYIIKLKTISMFRVQIMRDSVLFEHDNAID